MLAAYAVPNSAAVSTFVCVSGSGSGRGFPASPSGCAPRASSFGTAAGFPTVVRATPSATGTIMAVVAVLEMSIDSPAVATITARTSRRGDVPIRATNR